MALPIRWAPKAAHQLETIVYRLTPHAVEIVAICHGARLIEHALKDTE